MMGSLRLHLSPPALTVCSILLFSLKDGHTAYDLLSPRALQDSSGQDGASLLQFMDVVILIIQPRFLLSVRAPLVKVFTQSLSVLSQLVLIVLSLGQFLPPKFSWNKALMWFWENSFHKAWGAWKGVLHSIPGHFSLFMAVKRYRGVMFPKLYFILAYSTSICLSLQVQNFIKIIFIALSGPEITHT